MIKSILLRIIAFILSITDHFFYILFRILFGKDSLPADLRGRFDHLKSYTVQVDDPNYKPGEETKPIRRVGYEKELISTPVPGVTTLTGLLDHVVKQYGDLPMLGCRTFKKKTVEKIDGKDWEVFHFDDVKYETYNQIYSRIINLSRGIARFTGLNSKDFLGIFEETRKEWLMILHACMRYNITCMTCYATLGDESLIDAINECELPAMFVNEASLKKLAYQITPNTPSLKYLIYASSWESKKEETEKHIAELEKRGVSVLSFEEVEELGKQETNPIPVKEEQRNDSLVVVMYTSGTTAKTYLGYLPLSHILEMAAEHYILGLGGKIGYGNARTLSDKTAKPVGDLEAVAPQILCGVPRVYDTIRKGVTEKIKAGSPVVQWLFKTAYDCKLHALKNGRDTPLFNFLIFRKIQKMTGGRLVGCLSGGAAISKGSHEFFRVCFGASTFQGYGLTETSAAGVIMMPEARFQTNVAGVVVPSVEIKLISVPHLNYLADGKIPRGEIAIRGNGVSQGYYKQPEKTKEVFLDDGYFLTGDVGQLNEDGTISIIDRVKNLVKLAHGEYIALERLESIYCGSPYVAPNGIMVYGDSFSSFPVAIVIAQPGPTKRFAEENGITGTFSEICKHPKVQQQILKSLEEMAKGNKLKRYEEIKSIRVFDDIWSPENDLLTAAFKLKRNNIVTKYRSYIDEMNHETH